MIAESIYFKCIDCPKLRMIVSGIFLQGCLHFGCQIGAFFGQGCFLVYFRQNFSSLSQRRDSEKVGRDQVLKRSGIVRWAESGNNQSHRFDRSTQAVVIQRIQSTFRLTLETVRAYTVLTLLFLESLQDSSNCLHPFTVEDTAVTSYFPILVSQTKRVTKRVYLPFALVQFGLHICQVSHPVATRRSVVESIGVRINVDAKELTANDTFEHLFQLRIIVG